MLPLQLLCPPLTDHMPVWIQVPALRTPAASVKTANAERASKALRGNNAWSSRLPKTYARIRPVWWSSAPHSHLGCFLPPTKDHISSSSASFTLRITTAGGDPSPVVARAGFTGCSAGAFFWAWWAPSSGSLPARARCRGCYSHWAPCPLFAVWPPASSQRCDTAVKSSAARNPDYRTDSAVRHWAAAHTSPLLRFHTPDTALRQPPQSLLMPATDNRAHFISFNYFSALPFIVIYS